MPPPADDPISADLLPGGGEPQTKPDWEAFYRDYRKPGYIEGFEITTKLGGGMFGLVFRARRMSIGKDYAIKFLKVDDGDVRRAVLSELEQVKYFAQIDHPNLVSIDDRGEVNGIPYLIMAFAGTETLRDQMNASETGEGCAPKDAAKNELLRAFLQTCRGLHALHERSLVHFDIKPANVFIKGGVARLGDYGLSKLITHSRGSLSMGRGTPYYMAPEMLKRRGDVRSDVYSLGVMLYELLCGKVPFTGDSEWEVLRKHENMQAVLPSHLTATERKVLRRSLAKDPDDRFQSVQELLDAFEPLASLDAMPVAARKATSATAAVAVALPPPLPSDLPPRKSNALVGRSGRPQLGAKPGADNPMPRSMRPGEGRRRRMAASRVSSGKIWAIGIAVVSVLLSVGIGLYLFERSLDFDVEIFDAEIFDAEMRFQEAMDIQEEEQVEEPPSPLAELLRTVQEDRFTGQLATHGRLGYAERLLDLSKFDLPEDLAAYREIVRPVAEATRFVPVLAERAERLGYPAFVAAVGMLQDMNYKDGLDCQKAQNLQRLLGQMSGVNSLVVSEFSAFDPTASETRKFIAVAGGWRSIAEVLANSDSAYRDLLVMAGKSGSPGYSTKPR